MKLATLRDGTRDGRLIVVSSDLSRYVTADSVAPTLQSALDDWKAAEPRLRALSETLEQHDDGCPFDRKQVHAPLPRAYQWVDGSAYVNHVELVRKARNAAMPEGFWTDPLMYQGSSDTFYGPEDPILVEEESWGIDMEAEIAVIVDDVPMGISPEEAGRHICLVMLVNDVSLRGLIPGELAKGFGFLHGKPSTAFSPVAVTPDELGASWDGVRLDLPLCVDYNGRPFGRAEAGKDMTFGFPRLVAHAAKSRRLAAGSIIGSGTVSNKLDGGPGKPIAQGGAGYSCIAEIRMVETIRDGAPATPFMKFGDRVRIWMDDKDGNSIFGAIDQTVVQYDRNSP